MEIPIKLTIRDKVGEVAIIREDCRKKDKPLMNKLAYVSKQNPFYIEQGFRINNPVLRYGRFGKIHGYECWWIRISDFIHVLTDFKYIGTLERKNSIVLFRNVLENTSRFIKGKLSNEINYIQEIIKKIE